jgi:hypothetical protein
MRSRLLSRWLTGAQALAAVSLLLALSACSAGGGTGTQITSTSTNTPVTTTSPTPTPTLTPPVCGANFTNPAYYSTLPGATFQTTNVYAQVPMPPLTRAYDDDASGGIRGRHLCSAGNTASVLSFMTQHLTQLGWAETSQGSTACPGAAGYGQPECWTNGQYGLSMGVNSSTDWLIVFRDPDFVASVQPFQVTSVDLTVSPSSVAGQACGTQMTFTYTATFHVAPGGPGGTIQFAYTLNNGRSSANAHVNVSPGQTTVTYTFTSSGALPADHTYPGVAEVLVSSPDAVHSPQVQVAGACGAGAAFRVTSVTMVVSPSSIAGRTCGTPLTVTYTATFHLAPNGPGGTIHFEYTVNNGRGTTLATLAVAAGQTTATYSFTWSGTLPPDHTYPGLGGVMVDSPNQVSSPMVAPTGSCSS